RLPAAPAIDQARCDYIPYITLARPGARVVFTNSDRLLHDVHLVDVEGHERHAPLPPWASVTLDFEGEDRWQVLCDLHYWSRAWVITSRAPFATVSRDDGSFEIRDVPNGPSRLAVWGERLAPTSR